MEGYTVIACGNRMSENIDMMEALDLMPSYLSAFDSLTAVLQFAVEPDSISVVCWNLDEEEPEEESVEIDGSAIKLKDGNYVYEIKAEWTRFARFNGSAEYGFYTHKPTMETHPIPENN